MFLYYGFFLFFFYYRNCHLLLERCSIHQRSLHNGSVIWKHDVDVALQEHEYHVKHFNTHTLLLQQARQMAAVLLRRLLSSAFEEVYPALSPEDQTSVKSELLLFIQLEMQSTMRKKICDIVAELARNLIGTLSI